MTSDRRQQRLSQLGRFTLVVGTLVWLGACDTNSQRTSQVPSNAFDSSIKVESEALQTSVGPAETPEPIDRSESRMLAEQTLADGKVDDAYGHARDAYRHAADDPTVMYVMARVLGERHRYDEAISILDLVAEKDPQARLPTLGQTAQWMVLKGDWAGAEKRYRAILKEVPDIAMVHEEIAKLLLRQGRRQEAAVHLRQLCRSGIVKEHWMLELLSVSEDLHPLPGNEEDAPIGDLGIAQDLSAKGDRDKAITYFVNRYEQISETERSFLGRLLALEGNRNALKQWFDGDEPDKESSADAWFTSATLHQMRGEHAKAAFGFCQTVQRDATDDVAYQRLSESLMELSEEAAADCALDRAKQIGRTKSIGRQLVQSPDQKFDRINELAGLLHLLQREDESLAWRTIAIANSGLPKDEVQHAILSINEERLRRLDSESLAPDPNFVVCGLNLEKLRNLAE